MKLLLREIKWSKHNKITKTVLGLRHDFCKNVKWSMNMYWEFWGCKLYFYWILCVGKWRNNKSFLIHTNFLCNIILQKMVIKIMVQFWRSGGFFQIGIWFRLNIVECGRLKQSVYTGKGMVVRLEVSQIKRLTICTTENK